MENYQAWAEEVLEKVKEKMVWVSEKNKDIIPYTTDANGNYDDRSSEEKEWNHDDGLNWWTNGSGAALCGCCIRIPKRKNMRRLHWGFRTENGEMF